MSRPKLAHKSDVSAEQLLEGQRLLLSLSGTLSNPFNPEFEKNLMSALGKIAQHFQVEDCLLWTTEGNAYSSLTGTNVSDEYRSLLKTSFSGLTCESSVAWFGSNLLVGIRAGSEVVGVFCIHCREKDASQFPNYHLDLLRIASDMFSGFLLRASEQLTHRELDLRFRTVLDNLQEGVSIGDLDDRLLYVNHRYAEMVGYAPEELIGKRAYRFLVPKEEHSRIIEGTARRVAGGADAYECTQITKTGKRISTIINACPYRNMRGQVIGNISSHTDITVRRETEQENERLQKQLNRSQRMEAVGQLAAGFAHDLNNSLTAIAAHLNLVKYRDELSSDSRESLDAALAGCHSATELLRNVLTFSADSPVQAKVDELRKAIDEAIELTKAMLPKNTSVRISGQSQDYPVEIDRSLIVQALTNLIINAAQSMDKGGTISFSLSSTDIDVVDHLNKHAKPGRYWVLTVSDTGCGISEDVQHRVFEPFFSTKGEQSSGLGLSMVYTTMQRHKGWIEVDSTVGGGTAFSMYFPSPVERSKLEVERETISQESTQPTSKDANTISCGYIVVIDDEPVLGELACSFLERAGFKTKNFSNPLEAFEWYAVHSAETSLVLLDMKMPECDGVAAFEKLKSINPLAQIVLISGYVDDENVSKLLSRGAVSFIQKPVKYSELVEWVKKTIRVTGQSGPEALFH